MLRDALAVVGALSVSFSLTLVALAAVGCLRDHRDRRRRARDVVARAEQITREHAR